MIKDYISIILPTFNEVDSILTVIEWINKEMENYQYEILVVDDDSPDGTGLVVGKARENDPNLRLLTRTANPGLVPSICEGIHQSKGDICIWMDADLSMSPSLIPDFIREIKSGADLVLGSRYIPGGGMKGVTVNQTKTSLINILKNLKASEDSIISALISKFGNILLKYILHPSVHDYSSGFFGARKQFLLENMPSGTFLDYCLSLTYKAIKKGYKVKEIPMVLSTRIHGVSKTSENIYSILKIAFQCFSKAIWLRLTFRPGRKEENEIKLSVM